jgi:general stress protein 26
MAETTGKNDIQKLRDLIRDIRVAMLTTADEDGSLRSRPMATQETELDGDLWFFTAAYSPKVSEVKREHNVNLAYVKPDDERYVSVSGKAELVRDKGKTRELWNPALKAWFPQGLDDPELALLRVRVEKAEYWDSPSGKMVQLAGFAKAILTGKRYEPGENEKLDIEEARAREREMAESQR